MALALELPEEEGDQGLAGAEDLGSVGLGLPREEGGRTL